MTTATCSRYPTTCSFRRCSGSATAPNRPCLNAWRTNGRTPARARHRAIPELPARRQAVEAAQHKRRAPVRMFGIIERQPRQSPQQRGDGDLGLDAGELGAKAEMNAAAERQRANVGAGYVKPIRIGIDGGIAVGRSEQAQHALALGDRRLPDGDVLERDPACELD